MAQQDEKDNEIVLTRMFDAPRDVMWKAWTEPTQIAEWWGPKGFTNTIKKMDVRAGGTWEHIMHGSDGIDYFSALKYEEVIEPIKLVLRHAEPAILGLLPFKSIVTFDDVGGKTKVTMRGIFASAEEKEKQIKMVRAVEGATQTLERLADFLSKRVK